jgi:hypothetical protein
VAKAKDAANASLARMREAADRTLVAEAVTALPEEEPGWQLRSPIVRVFQTPKTIPHGTVPAPNRLRRNSVLDVQSRLLAATSPWARLLRFSAVSLAIGSSTSRGQTGAGTVAMTRVSWLWPTRLLVLANIQG